MKKTTAKAAAAKATKATAAKKAVKKVNLAEVGKNKPARKAKDEDKKKKVNLTEVAAKKRGRKSNAQKAAEAEAAAKLAAKQAKKAEKAAAKAKEEKAPAKKVEKATNAYDWAVANIKKPTDAAARKLQPGDVIETFYNDTKEPTVEIVIASCERDEDIFDVITVMKEKWQAGRVTTLTKVNTDMWRKIGTLNFKLTKE